jgi:hypothetical protein
LPAVADRGAAHGKVARKAGEAGTGSEKSAPTSAKSEMVTTGSVSRSASEHLGKPRQGVG